MVTNMFLKNEIEKIKTNWKSFLIEETKKDYFIKLNSFIENEYSVNKVYPCKEAIFRCLTYFNFEQTKLVILGQDPYHIPNMADGLSFSTTLKKCPKSLKNIFNELKNDFGIDRLNYDLTDIAKQGVLLLNRVLTVQENKAFSHSNKGWEVLTNNLIYWLSKKNKNVIYLLMGKNAWEIQESINSSLMIFKTSHPSPFSYHLSFKNSNVFKKINDVLETNDLYPIKW